MTITTPDITRRTLTALASLATLTGLASQVQAVDVPAGSAGVALSGTTVAAKPELAGTVLVDRIREFSITSPTGAVLHGTFQDRVVKRTSTGQLEFSYRIKNAADSTGNIVVVRRLGFAGFPNLDIDYRLDGLGSVGAKAVSRPGGDIVTQFDFYNAPIKPGEESRFHFISTTATEYEETGLATIQASFDVRTGFAVYAPKEAPKVAPVRPILINPIKIKLPNLKTELIAPRKVKPGQDISDLIRVKAFNSGNSTAPGTSGTLNPSNGYMIDIMLSTDTKVPNTFANYSPNYSEDVLLLGGRISNTEDIAPGENATYKADATIPANTPRGDYYLAVRIDSGNKVLESNEADNTFFLPIKVY